MDYKDFQLQKDQKELYFWYNARQNLIFNLLRSIFGDFKKDRQILNIGCGTGTELKIIKCFGSIVALDKNQDALNEVGKLKIKTIQADIEKCSLPKEYYDVICCFDVLEHLKNDQQTIGNIYQALKPGGYFIFTIPAFQFLFNQHDIAMEHLRRYSKQGINAQLKKAGFKIIRLDHWNTLLFPIIFVVRIFGKILIRCKLRKCNFQSEAKCLNKYLNKLLFWILNLENNQFVFNLSKPFGLSIYGITKKQ